VVSQWTRVPFHPSRVIHWSTWVPRFSFSTFPVVRNLHKLESLTLTQLISKYTTKVRGSRSKHTRQTCSNSRTHVEREEHKNSTAELQLKHLLESQNYQSSNVVAVSRCHRMFNRWLVYWWRRLGASYIAPKGQRSRCSFIRKALIVFYQWAHRTVRCTTEQWTVCDSLPCLVNLTVASL
jgi:hypothetical protein